MGIQMKQCEAWVPAAQSTDDWMGDRVIAAKAERTRSAVQYSCHRRLYLRLDITRPGELHVTGVPDNAGGAQIGERLAPAIVRIGVQCCPDEGRSGRGP